MKDISPILPRNTQTQQVIDEMQNWIERHITDETVGFSIVSVTDNGVVADIEHKSACGGVLTRIDLARMCYNAVLRKANADVIEVKAAANTHNAAQIMKGLGIG
tara:strand:- start:6647 stop:6958 length:312 start_codon:yes stop_codon:yes gene_type:complete